MEGEKFVWAARARPRYPKCPKEGGTPLYSTILLLSSAMGAGGDVVPAGGWGLGPRDGAGCHGAPAPPPPSCCDTPAPSLLDRLRAKWAARQQDCCPSAPAPQAKPAPAAPAPAPAAAPCCDPCAQRVSLLDRIRARLAARKHKDCCQPCPSGCAPAGDHKPPSGSTPPKEMPKPKEKVVAPPASNSHPPAIAIPVPPPVNSSNGGTPY
jgi:hypothetical protein